MNFEVQPINIDFPTLRLVSTSGQQKWSMGVRPVIFGFRVSAYRQGTIDYIGDYCCGQDCALIQNTLRQTYRIMCAQPDDIHGRDLKELFPQDPEGVRPINRGSGYTLLVQAASQYPEVEISEELALVFDMFTPSTLNFLLQAGNQYLVSKLDESKQN